MNLIDVTIVDIVDPPKQVVTDELCCWETTVMISGYGGKRERVLRAISRKEISRYCVGFSWME